MYEAPCWSGRQKKLLHHHVDSLSAMSSPTPSSPLIHGESTFVGCLMTNHRHYNFVKSLSLPLFLSLILDFHASKKRNLHSFTAHTPALLIPPIPFVCHLAPSHKVSGGNFFYITLLFSHKRRRISVQFVCFLIKGSDDDGRRKSGICKTKKFCRKNGKRMWERG